MLFRSKGGQWQRALDLLERCESSGIKPNVITYSSAISACEKGGQWQRALDLLERCESAGIKPNVITYSCVMSACQNAGRAGRAMAVAERSGFVMTRGGILEIDLHGLTAAVAMSTVECWLVSLAFGGAFGLGVQMQGDLVIITGRGSHSQDGEARLQSAMLRLLNHQLQPPLRASVDESNAGRVIVRAADFEDWTRVAMV